MADQLRWWKLWTSALSDPDLENLSLEDWARWARLGAWLRGHGEDGAAVSPHPHDALTTLLRHPHHGGPWGSRDAAAKRVRQTLSRLPGVVVEDVPGGLRISMRNWRKYQEDSSVQRTRTWRERRRQRDGQQTVTGDGQPLSHVTVQTRRDETVPPTPVGESSQPATAQQRRLADLATRLARPIAGSTAPPEAWHHDCPQPLWRGRCVDRAWATAHPDVSMPVVPDDHGGYRPRECPHHRDQP